MIITDIFIGVLVPVILTLTLVNAAIQMIWVGFNEHR